MKNLEAVKDEIFNPEHIMDLYGEEIKTKMNAGEYLHQICAVFEYLGRASSAVAQVVSQDGELTDTQDYGHYLLHQTAINEVKKFGQLFGITEK